MPGAGIEPARCCHRGILSPLRLPISPSGLNMKARTILPESAMGFSSSCGKAIILTKKSTRYNSDAFRYGGRARNRTEVHGFAIRCIATLPPSRVDFLHNLSKITRPETQTRSLEFGAGNEIRTRDPNLGKVVLYQLSYSRLKRCAHCNV